MSFYLLGKVSSTWCKSFYFRKRRELYKSTCRDCGHSRMSWFPHCPWRDVSDTLILLWFDVDKSHTLPPCTSPSPRIGPPHRLSPLYSWLNLPDSLLPSGIHQDSLRSSDRGGLWLISQSTAISCLIFSCEKPQLLFFSSQVCLDVTFPFAPAILTLSLIRVVTFTWAALSQQMKGEGGRTGR